MGRLINDLLTPYHIRAKDRDYLHRMNDEKVHCMEIARQYEEQYWDGDRRYGYGGYKYDGRWKAFAEQLIERYNLKDGDKVLDVGCGKAYVTYELSQLLPNSEIVGMDISQWGMADAQEGIRDHLITHRAEDAYPWGDDYFDLVISMNTFHNLQVFQLSSALQEVERVGKQGYITMESYRSSEELFNLQCWALTCEGWYRPESWIWLFSHFGYTGDYEFIYFE